MQLRCGPDFFSKENWKGWFLLAQKHKQHTETQKGAISTSYYAWICYYAYAYVLVKTSLLKWTPDDFRFTTPRHRSSVRIKITLPLKLLLSLSL